jgi:hypothetical protein
MPKRVVLDLADVESHTPDLAKSATQKKRKRKSERAGGVKKFKRGERVSVKVSVVFVILRR